MRDSEPRWVMATTLLFVYGTLLSGERHHPLLAEAEPGGPARTAAAFDFVDCGGFPAIVPGGTTAIAGEVYAVDGATLAAIDRLEDHPHFYRRTAICLADGRLVEAYLLDRDRAAGLPRLPSGDWRDHR